MQYTHSYSLPVCRNGVFFSPNKNKIFEEAMKLEEVVEYICWIC